MGAVMLGGIITGKPPVSLSQATPLARLTSEYNVFVLPAASPLKTMKDVVEQLKKDPGSVKWGGGSRGSTEHIAAAMLAREVGVDPAKINYVAFRGGGEAIAAILGGNVTVGGSGYSEFAEYITTGKMRAIAVTSETRLKGIDVPTLKEQGINVVIGNWRGVYGAGGITPAQRKALTDLHRQGDQDQVLGRGAGEEQLDAGAADRRRLREVRRRRVREPARGDGQVGNDLKGPSPQLAIGVGTLVARRRARGSARSASRRRPATRASGRTSCPGWSARCCCALRRAAASARRAAAAIATWRSRRAPPRATGPASSGSRSASSLNAALITTIGFILSCALCFVLAVRGFKSAEGRLDLEPARPGGRRGDRLRDRRAGVLDVHAAARRSTCRG